MNHLEVWSVDRIQDRPMVIFVIFLSLYPVGGLLRVATDARQLFWVCNPQENIIPTAYAFWDAGTELPVLSTLYIVCVLTTHALAIYFMPIRLERISKILPFTSGVSLEGLPSFLSGFLRFQISKPDTTR